MNLDRYDNCASCRNAIAEAGATIDADPSKRFKVEPFEMNGTEHVDVVPVTT